MTIAAGYICTDGVLLTSDTLYSGLAKQYGQKFWVIEKGGYAVVIGGAGTEPALKRIKNDAEDQLKPSFSRRQIIETIDEILAYVVGKLKSPEAPEILVVLRLPARVDLFACQHGETTLAPIDFGSRAVGYAQGLGEYLGAMLYAQPTTMKWAKVVAAYVVKQAKDYAGYCDGDTYFVEVPSVGPIVEVRDQAQIAELESLLAPLNSALRMVLPDGSANEETLALRLRLMTAAIEKGQRTMVVMPPTGPMSIESGSSNVVLTATTRPQIRWSDPAAPPSQTDPTRDPKDPKP